MACKQEPLDWSTSSLLLIDDDNFHIDNTIKKKFEEEEDEEEEYEDEEEEDEEEDETDWETEDDDEDFEWVLASEEDLETTPPSPKRSLPDVEGAIPKTILRKLPNSVIRKIIIHVKKHILMLETENYLYEKTIEKLEASEKEIDSRIPPTADEEFEEHLKKTRVLICSSGSEDDEPPNQTGNYEPVHAIDEIHMSQDSFFENMSDNSKGTAFEFFRTVGDLAPTNYDVMHHKYGAYVGTAAERSDFMGEPGVRTRLNTQIINSRVQLDEKMSSATAAANKPGVAAGENKRKSSLEVRQSITSGVDVEDEDFADFNLADAKKLSITDRLRFALEEEEEFRKRFYHHETQALKDESSIQVHIDAHKHALGILMGIRKDFRLIANGATGTGMNGKTMADLLVKFHRKMRNQLSAEETRARITIRKVMAQKKRTLEQLKINKEAGRSLSHIDFEYLLCESSILETEINGMNNTLQHLKDLTAQFHLVLQDERQMLDKMVKQENQMNLELKRRHDLLHHFHDAYIKYRHQISEANSRMDQIKKRINEEQAPQPLDYINLKSSQYDLETEVHSLERKLEDISFSLINMRGQYNHYMKYLPEGRSIEQENEDWLKEIKQEMKQHKKNIARASADADSEHTHTAQSVTISHPGKVSDDIDEDIWEASERLASKVLSSSEKSRLTLSARASMRMKQASNSQNKIPTMMAILSQPRRFDSAKALKNRSKTPVYDLDFDINVENDEDEDIEIDSKRPSDASEEV